GYQIHIHQNLVPINGSCADTLGHLDPFRVNPNPGKPYPCDPNDIRTCEAGDLSGKHGLLRAANGTGWLTGAELMSFLDPQLGWNANAPDANILMSRSVVIHRPSDAVRYTCANIVETDKDWRPLHPGTLYASTFSAAAHGGPHTSSPARFWLVLAAVVATIVPSVVLGHGMR
ncbi:hypothetical protein THASP1DRAFT_18734, partial [Thamnocephalis sphaerospora]